MRDRLILERRAVRALHRVRRNLREAGRVNEVILERGVVILAGGQIYCTAGQER